MIYTIRHAGESPAPFKVPKGQAVLRTFADGKRTVMLVRPNELVQLVMCDKPCCAATYPVTIELVSLDVSAILAGMPAIMVAIVGDGGGPEPTKH